MIELGSGHATSTATPSAFFAKWIDHKSWSDWSPDTDWVRLDGAVSLGAHGVMKPKGGPKLKFVISALAQDQEYTDCTSLFGACILFRHLAEATSSGTDLRVAVAVDGPLSRVWAVILGKNFRQSAQADLDRLVEIVEQTP